MPDQSPTTSSGRGLAFARRASGNNRFRARQRLRRCPHIGCSGWDYPHWREVFYPKGCPQRAGSRTTPSTSTPSRSTTPSTGCPRAAAVRGWAEQSPPGFIFAVKASRYLTHIKRLAHDRGGHEALLRALEPLIGSEKLGPVLWQFPPNFHRDTSASRARWRSCRRDDTRSSSGTRAGSRRGLRLAPRPRRRPGDRR